MNGIPGSVSRWRTGSSMVSTSAARASSSLASGTSGSMDCSSSDWIGITSGTIRFGPLPSTSSMEMERGSMVGRLARLRRN